MLFLDILSQDVGKQESGHETPVRAIRSKPLAFATGAVSYGI
jgi:hypothetical protein